MLLVAKAEPALSAYSHLRGADRLGRLVGPRHVGDVGMLASAGRPWGADNDCFQGLDADAYGKMVERLPRGGLFVTVPDVVGDHPATLRLWYRWAEKVRAAGHVPAFVLQDGCDRFGQVPADAGALFVGGSTAYKLSSTASALVREGRQRGMWVHMGRVSTRRRIMYAQSVGVDSIDSSKFALWADLEIPWALSMLAAEASQMNLETLLHEHERV